MADLLFGDLGLILVPKRKERQFRLHDDFSLTDFTDRSCSHFGRESIEFLVELFRDDLERPMSQNHDLSTTALFCLWKLSPSYWRYSRPVKIYRIRHCQLHLVCPYTKTIHFIKWPSTEAEIVQMKQGFYDEGGFPGVVGCVDGMHMKIQGPTKNENDYVN